VTHQISEVSSKVVFTYEIYLAEEVPKFEFKISSLDNDHDFQHCCFFSNNVCVEVRVLVRNIDKFSTKT
jgi:hypothetical protein